MILIGSRALSLRAPQILLRNPKDFDFVCTQDEFEGWLENNRNKVQPTKIYPLNDGKKMIVEGSSNCEFEIVKSNTSSEMLYNFVKNDPESIPTSFGHIPNLDMLFTIKSSHKYLKNSPHFWKTLVDYHLMKETGAKIRDEYKEFHKIREKETYNYAHPKLNQSKDMFFSDNGVQMKYHHDDIHSAICLYDKPAYLYYMEDGEEVKSSKEKFFKCSREMQLAGVIEEAITLSIERSLVPYPGVKTPDEAFKFALSKVCSSITSGFFRKFAYNNALEVLKIYPRDYFDKFQQAVKNGKVRLFQQPDGNVTV